MPRRPLIAAVAGLAALASTLTGCGIIGGQPADLQIYSARHYDLEGAFGQFTDETGISVEFISGDDAELLERLKAEGEDSPADVFMTVDAGNLWNAARQDELAALDSTVLNEAVPADLRDPEGRWYGLAMRARTVTYNPDNVDPAEFDAAETYAGLADPKWKGRLCMRDATSSYTQSLVASLIDLHGREKALEIAKGWVANDVQIMSNDVLLLEAIDMPQLAADPRFATMAARSEHREALTDVLDAKFGTESMSYWVDLLGATVPVGPVYDIREALENPFLDEIGMIQAVPHAQKPDMRLLSNPLRIDGERLSLAAGSALGADNAQLLARGR